MVAVLSATTAVHPPVIKKRGAPRKVIDESAVLPEKLTIRNASTKAKPTPKIKTMDAMKEKKKTLTRVSDYKTKKGTSATHTSSKILDEVKATGAFTKSAAITNSIASAGTASLSQSEPQIESEQPFIPPMPGPAPVAPIQQPVNDVPPKPIVQPTMSAPSERANIIPPKPRATTIPLPRKPLTAPSPTSEPLQSRVNFAEPAPRAPRAPPRYPKRMIEPTPNTKLPPKYKKAARQVTSIIVGIPIIIVVGYELYGRWKTQINTKFEERSRRDQESKQSRASALNRFDV